MGEEIRKPRGTRDLFGEELNRIREVQVNLKLVFKRYGYEEIETPIFENLELFTEKSGSEIMDQIYHFEDKSQRKLALRPELTAPSIRLYNNQLKSEPKPLKIFYFGPCFRYERPQAERWRQFSQAGVELIGSDRPEADAEVIALTYDSLESLNVENYTLRIGQIGLLRKVLEYGNVPRDSQDPVLRAIDDKEEEKIDAEMKKAGVTEEAQELLWSLIELQGSRNIIDEAEDLLQEVPEIEEYIENFRSILERLQQMSVKNYELDLGVARGLEYYTGSVFEVYFNGVQIGGGGRYDDLIESLGGESTPAVGVGLGLDRMAKVLEKLDKQIEDSDLDAMILPVNEDMLEESLGMARKLRSLGYKVDIDLMGRSLGKALSYADSKGVRYAIIVGPEDMEEGRVTIRDMETGDQERIFREALPKRLKD